MNGRTSMRRLATIGLALALAGAFWAVTLAANAIICAGGPCAGAAQRDEITGSDGADQIDALGGFDNIEGGDGDDEMHGGAGADELYGGAGDDVYYGEDGWDFMQEQDNIVSNDEMHGGPGLDGLQGGGGDDQLYGEDGDDAFGADPNLWGGPGDDLVDGGPGNDSIAGQQGNDTLVGGEGDDFIMASVDESKRSRDTIHCGPGIDEVQANRNDIIADDPATDDVCEAVHFVGGHKHGGKAQQGTAKANQPAAQVDQQRWRQAFLAKLRGGQ
jgi:Ca2+-binding RTX toxin-like protein